MTMDGRSAYGYSHESLKKAEDRSPASFLLHFLVTILVTMVAKKWQNLLIFSKRLLHLDMGKPA